jgi:Tfp pilus assembly protein PilE
MPTAPTPAPAPAPAPASDPILDTQVFWERHKTTIVAVVAVLLLAALAYGGYRLYVAHREDSAARLLAGARTVEQYQQVIGSYGNSNAAASAHLLMAGELREQKKFEEANRTLREFVERQPRHQMDDGCGCESRVARACRRGAGNVSARRGRTSPELQRADGVARAGDDPPRERPDGGGAARLRNNHCATQRLVCSDGSAAALADVETSCSAGCGPSCAGCGGAAAVGAFTGDGISSSASSSHALRAASRHAATAPIAARQAQAPG